MADLSNLVTEAKTYVHEIEKTFTNFKKDSPSRKTKEYLTSRRKRIEELWERTVKCNGDIAKHQANNKEHPYFTSNYFGQAEQMYSAFMSALEIAEQTLNTQDSGEDAQVEKPLQASIEVSVESKVSKMQRRQQEIIATLVRNIGTVRDSDGTTQTRSFYKVKLETIKGLWTQLEELQYNLLEYQDLSSQEEFIQLEEETQQLLIWLSSKLEEQTNGSSAATTPCPTLPNITLLKFDGNYLLWPQFCDLFTQAVHGQRMTNSQKMWYLKTNLVKDAEKMIRHLAISDANYETAWNLLKERYENPRLLVSSLLARLLAQPSYTTETMSANAIKNMHDVTNECLHGLNNLGVATESWDPIIIHILLRRLDKTTHALYEQSLQKPKELPSLQHFLNFLENRFQTLEVLSPKAGVKGTQRETWTINQKTVTTVVDSGCVKCDGPHLLSQCKEFRSMAQPDKVEYVRRLKVCQNCLKNGHKAINCKGRPCLKCNKSHHTLLHIETNKNADSIARNAKQHSSVVASNHQSVVSHPKDIKQPYVILATAIVVIKANGRQVNCRALLDSSSQLNLITSKVVRALGIEPWHISMSIQGIGSSSQRTNRRVHVQLHSRVNGYCSSMEAFVLESIVPDQPSKRLNISAWNIPKNLNLADPEFNVPNTIDLLIGAEFYPELLSIGQIHLGPKNPILQNTLLGWTMSGKTHHSDTSNSMCGITVHDDLESAIERFWTLEEINKDKKKMMTPAEQQCERHFTQNVQRHHNGQFVVKLPFQNDPSMLGNSREIALKRWLSTERRLSKDESLKRQYTTFMHEYLQLGHMQEIKTVPEHHLFLPHHAVLKPDSTTTKLRVVFDASAKTSTNVSLNDTLHIGPTIQSDLFAILLRFRMNRFVFTADIEKMYRQILVQECDRRYQLILWRESSNQPIKPYQLNTVTYGTSAAPYLAIRCLHQLAKEAEKRYPEASEIILENFYVDDVMSGANSLHETKFKREQLSKLLNEAGFHLRKWCSNDKRILQDIKPEDQAVQLDISDNREAHEIKTLGLTWIPATDEFRIKAIPNECRKITKRTIASDIASLFDPLGFLAPVILKAKLFLQHLWDLKLDWDAAIPEQLQSSWETFRNGLPTLNKIRIPRHVSHGNTIISSQIHAFSDASERGYGTAIYLRSVTKESGIIIRLLCAKSRVAPRKKVTLPRLELCAANLAAELSNKVKKTLNLEDVPSYLWTDSEIVLAWINSSSSEFHTFVANRIAGIHEHSTPSQWRHIRSKENPADIVSRGLNPSELINHSLWFYGPRFLHGKESIWPTEYQKRSSVDLERKPLTLTVQHGTTTITETSSSSIFDRIQHQNSFRRLTRVLGYMLRCINRMKGNAIPTSRVLTTDEINDAMTIIIKVMQQSEFRKEILQLQQSREVKGESSLIRLAPFLDERGMLRVTGRIQASGLSYDSKHPKIIPYGHPYTRMIMEDLHIENHHVGENGLVKITQDTGFWIIKGKNVARAVVQKCIRCARSKPKLFTQIMGNLPVDRVQPARPFMNSGVDFAGPVWVHYKIRGKRPQKAYIAIFCCFPTKAVHLELVSDLTTNAFIGALKRFIARRGRIRNLYCDNATNFVGAKNQLAELQDSIYGQWPREKIANACVEKGIDFHFIPPRAPHFGGLWEAAVKSAKQLMLKSVNAASLTYEELETVIVEIEAILNSRPLTPISPDPKDLSALTPGHFLIGESLSAQVDPIAKQDNSLTMLARWKLVTHIKQEFWRRWSQEYLHELQQRYKWNKHIQNIKPDTLVIIKEDHVPVMQWPLGRIVKVFHGDDGLIRVVDVQTPNGVFRRAVHRLAPLPVEVDNNINPFQNEAEDLTNPPGCHNEKSTPQQTSCSERSSSKIQAHKQSKITKDQDGRPAAKRSRLSTFMLGSLLVMSIITNVNGSYQSEQLDAGMYSENLGSIQLKRGTLRSKLSFKQSDFEADKIVITNTTSQTKLLCDLSKRIHVQSHCDTLMSQLNQKQDTLVKEINLLFHHPKVRKSRGVVGTVLQAAFGVNDEVYRELDGLHADQQKIINLAKHQTAIMLTTVTNINKTESKITAYIEAFTIKLNQGMKAIEIMQNSIRAIDGNSVDLNFLMVHQIVHQLLDQYYDKFTRIHQAVSRRNNFEDLISSTQLSEIIKEATAHLPSNLIINHRSSNPVEVWKNSTTLTIQGAFDIIEIEQYDVIKTTPVPEVLMDNRYKIVDIPNTIIAVNYARQMYFELTEYELQSCGHFNNKTTWICRPPAISKINSNSSCVIDELFKRRNHTICPVRTIEIKGTVWKRLYRRNTWMFIATNPIEVAVYCDNERNDLSINGVGWINFKDNCHLETHNIVIKPEISAEFEVLETRFKAINVSIPNTTPESESIKFTITKDTILKPSEDVFGSAINELIDLSHEQETISWTQYVKRPTVRHSGLLFIIIFTALAIGVRYLRKSTEVSNNNINSTPAPTAAPIPATRHLRDDTSHELNSVQRGEDVHN